MRTDLLTLTADDLASLSNRGLARRAEQEATTGTLTCDIAEDAAGTLIVQWSDGIECQLPAQARLADSRCTCAATTLCRHILRSVFAYQRLHAHAHGTGAQQLSTPSGSTARPIEIAWNPANITDEHLAAHFSSAELIRLRREFSAGHVMQLQTGEKPRALIHSLGCTVNFLAPNELRYAVCDCAAQAPCGHVALAIWGFRLLQAGTTHGLISTVPLPPAAPGKLLDEIENDLLALAQTGLARMGPLQVDRWRRLAERARNEHLIWPAEVLHDLAEAHAAYLAHDARFDSRDFATLLAELVQRLDAIRAACTPVPHPFIRGSANDRELQFGSARLIGIGCSVRISRMSTEIMAHLQDSDSGALTVIGRRFAHVSDQSASMDFGSKSFSELARSVALKGASFAAIGCGQLLIKGARRTPSGRLVPGRAPSSVAPQTYAWESLRPPVRTPGFAEARETLLEAPPDVLSPRQAGSRLLVCPVALATDVHFNVARQEVTARLTDSHGDSAWLVHPYMSRGASGCEKLLRALQASANEVRFISGYARMAGARLLLQPLSVVMEDRGQRFCIQPWIEENAPSESAIESVAPHGVVTAQVDPLHDYLDELLDCLAERWLLGPKHATPWSRLATLGTSLGFVRLADVSRLDEAPRLLELTVAADFAFREFSRLDIDPEQGADTANA